MAYQLQDYRGILGMQGISDKTLQNHFKLYEGYLNNTNALMEKTRQLLDAGQGKTPEFAELRRRLGFEFNGMRLHEYYFENLKGDGQPDSDSLIHQQLARDYGSFERWRDDFIATGSMRGIGWAVMFYDTRGDQLQHVWVDEHQINILPGVQPLLVMDVWEHAFYLDYAADRAGYIAAFFQNLNWQEVARRFEENSEVQRRKKAA